MVRGIFSLTPYPADTGCSGGRCGPLKPKTGGQSLKKLQNIRVMWDTKCSTQPIHDGYFFILNHYER